MTNILRFCAFGPVRLSILLCIAVTVLSCNTATQAPPKEEIAKMCLQLFKGTWHQRGLDNTGNPVFPGAGVVLGDIADVVGVRQTSGTEIEAKVVITMTWTRTLTVISGWPELVGQKGKIQKSEERCLLKRYDTGWSADQWLN